MRQMYNSQFGNYKLKIILLLLSAYCLLLAAPTVHASVVKDASPTTALTRGLVGYWTFDGPSSTAGADYGAGKDTMLK